MSLQNVCMKKKTNKKGSFYGRLELNTSSYELLLFWGYKRGSEAIKARISTLFSGQITRLKCAVLLYGPDAVCWKLISHITTPVEWSTHMANKTTVVWAKSFFSPLHCNQYSCILEDPGCLCGSTVDAMREEDIFRSHILEKGHCPRLCLLILWQ